MSDPHDSLFGSIHTPVNNQSEIYIIRIIKEIVTRMSAMFGAAGVAQANGAGECYGRDATETYQSRSMYTHA